MTQLLAHKNSQITTAAVVAALCLAPIAVQADNLWNPYPTTTQPAPSQPPALAAPAPKPKYYKEPATVAPSAQAQQQTPSGPSKFAPADLDRQLSAPPYPQSPPATPYGYQGAPLTPYAGYPAYNGPPAGGYPQGYPTPGNPPPYMGGYGGNSPPWGNNSWGGSPGNNFSPFGFW